MPHTYLIMYYFIIQVMRKANIMDKRYDNNNTEKCQQSPTSLNEEKRCIGAKDHSISKLET